MRLRLQLDLPRVISQSAFTSNFGGFTRGITILREVVGRKGLLVGISGGRPDVVARFLSVSPTRLRAVLWYIPVLYPP